MKRGLIRYGTTEMGQKGYYCNRWGVGKGWVYVGLASIPLSMSLVGLAPANPSTEL